MTGKSDLAGQQGEPQAPASQRIDKWLWHARFARTRTAAQRLVVSGKVRVNRQKITSASRPVRPGDVLTLVAGRTVRVIEIIAIAARRGSAEAAKALYSDRSPAIKVSAPNPQQEPAAGTAISSGKPDKRGRQRILELKRKQF
jgi:ribosome-associated heat shock protein Hsp15